jgi:hypothetical protein
VEGFAADDIDHRTPVQIVKFLCARHDEVSGEEGISDCYPFGEGHCDHCEWAKVILEDAEPCQHFAEVLSSIRQMGHQVVCTVQDSALADLLCRRLRSASLGDGLRVEMEYEPGSGAKVKAVEQIGPLPEHVLMSA